jgi:cell division protein FtsA
MENAGELGKLGAGAVLTGGGAGLAGAVEVAQHAFGMPVRIGLPGEGLLGLADTVRRPQFATATGLALFGSDSITESAFSVSLREGVPGRVIAWLKEFF